jgi:tRNA nucleotidyltransferase (CCA-adding enzyme)
MELPPAALAVAESVRAAGGRALLVGGCVRDALLGSKPGDFDFECFGLPGEKLIAVLGEKFELDLVGASFGVVKLKHLDIDISLPRRETKLGLGHRAFSVDSDPSLPLEEASARRDFTVNAIYFDPLTLELLDPWNGCGDLERGILRHVSGHFGEDPLRVLRGMQFAARFRLRPAQETVDVCRTMDCENLPRERLFGEWAKLLAKGERISAGLDFLREANWLRYYPELERLVGCKQDPQWHPEGDVWNHTLKSLDAFAGRRGDEPESENVIVGLAVLCHDFGKPATTRYDRERGRIRSLGHDEAGVAPTLSFLRRLTCEERILKEVPPLVRTHMRPFALWRNGCSDGAIRRLAAEIVRIDRLVRVAAADEGSGSGELPESCRWLLERARRLEIADSAPAPLVMGRDLIARGMKPGPEFGKILKEVYEAQLDGAFSDRAGAYEYLAKNKIPGCREGG